MSSKANRKNLIVHDRIRMAKFVAKPVTILIK